MDGPKTILVADRDEQRRAFLCAQLAADGYQPVAAKTAEQARVQARNHAPQLLVLSELERAAEPLGLLAEIRTGDERATGLDPAIPAIVLTPDGGELALLRAFERGADDVIALPVRYLELRARIGALLRRAGGELRRTRTTVGGLTVDRPTRTASYQGEPIGLSTLEFALLDRLAAEPTRVLTKHTLLREVWGLPACARTRTVDAHACRLRRKLAAAGAPSMVISRRGVGYALIEVPAHAPTQANIERGRRLRAA